MIFEHLGDNVQFVYNNENYMFSNFLHNFNFLEKLPQKLLTIWQNISFWNLFYYCNN